MAEVNAGELKKREGEPQGLVRMLVVEDDTAVLETLQVVVELDGGFEPSFSDNVTDALQLLRQAKQDGKPFEVVFSDLGLREEEDGGLKIADAIKKEGLAKYVTLYIGRAEQIRAQFTKEQLQERGINEVLAKAGKLTDLQNSFVGAKQAVTKS